MDSIFRTRGSGVSSDVENTIVPQLLSEIDGVEGLENVIVIGASNREDMIDPAILRPGRLDVKIKIERPDAEAARDIFSQVPHHRRCRCTPTTWPSTAAAARRPSPAMIQRTVERMYTETEENRFLEVTYANGDKEVLYFKDFNSGAMIAEHRRPGEEDGDQGLPRDRRRRACGCSTCWRPASTSSRRTRTCPTRPTPTTGRGSPARRASGSSTSARSSRGKGTESGRSIDTVANTGQYL